MTTTQIVPLETSPSYITIPQHIVDALAPFYPTVDLSKVRIYSAKSQWAGRAAGFVILNEVYIHEWWLPYLFTTYGGLTVLAHELQHVAQGLRSWSPFTFTFVAFIAGFFIPYTQRWEEIEAEQQAWGIVAYFDTHGWPI